MSKSEFYVVIIKLMGLYWLMQASYNLILFIGSLISSISFYTGDTSSGAFDFSMGNPLAYMWWVNLVFVLFFYRLVFYKTDWIVDKLKLCKNPDEKMFNNCKIDAIHVLQVGIILFGGMLILNHLPQSIRSVIEIFNEQVAFNQEATKYSPSFWWMYSLVYVLIGVFLITRFESISKFLFKKELIKNE